MRRTDEEFKAEVFRRKAAYCRKRRKRIAAFSVSILPASFRDMTREIPSCSSTRAFRSMASLDTEDPVSSGAIYSVAGVVIKNTAQP